MVALSSEDFKTWLNGLQLLLHLGSVNISRVKFIMTKLYNIVDESPNFFYILVKVV